MRLFGNRETFAIQYRPDTDYIPKKYAFAFCHLILDGKLIGNPEESCMLASWYHYFKRFRDRIEKRETELYISLFDQLSNREIFELILCDLFQSKDKYEVEFPWKARDKHILTIDETVDGYHVVVIEKNHQLLFLWESRGWYEPQQEVGKLYNVSVSYEEFYKTSDECLNYLFETYKRHLGNV